VPVNAQGYLDENFDLTSTNRASAGWAIRRHGSGRGLSLPHSDIVRERMTR
jgi:hypothetical protein